MCNFLKIEFPQTEVCEITFNRSEQSNALNLEMVETLNATLTELQDSDIRILVLTGAGNYFCAGADLNDMLNSGRKTGKHKNFNSALQLAELLDRLNHLELVTIAKVNGATYGGGVGLLCCCDLVVSTTEASFSFSELKLGLIPATITPYVLNTMGERNARRFMLSAETIDHITAREIGLVHELVAEFELDNRVNEHIKNILTTGPTAQKQCKKMLLHHFQLNRQQIEASAELLANIRQSPEAIEGVKAFLNKREPNWIHH